MSEGFAGAVFGPGETNVGVGESVVVGASKRLNASSAVSELILFWWKPFFCRAADARWGNQGVCDRRLSGAALNQI
jgi:hypothetical protein